MLSNFLQHSSTPLQQMLTVHDRGQVRCQQVKGGTVLVPKGSVYRNYLDYMMDRKASEARKKLMDWDKRKDRRTKGYEEGSDSQVQ